MCGRLAASCCGPALDDRLTAQAAYVLPAGGNSNRNREQLRVVFEISAGFQSRVRLSPVAIQSLSGPPLISGTSVFQFCELSIFTQHPSLRRWQRYYADLGEVGGENPGRQTAPMKVLAAEVLNNNWIFRVPPHDTPRPWCLHVTRSCCQAHTAALENSKDA